MVRRTTAELLPAEDVIEVEIGGQRPVTAADEMADEWSDFLSGSGDAAMIYVYRQPGNGQTAFEFVDSFPADQFEPASLMKRLRNEFGGGNYRVQLRNGGRVKSNKLMSVAAPLKGDTPRESGDTGIMRAMLEEMRQMRQEQNKAADPMASMQTMLAMMASMKEVLGLGQPRNAVREMVETMTAINELRDLNPAPEESGGPGWVGPLLNALPTLVQAAMARPVVQAPPRPVQTVKPNPAPVAAGAATVTENLNDQQRVIIADYLGKACAAASWGVPAETAADKVMEHVSEEQAAQIEAMLTVPNLLDEAAKIVPDVAKYRDWFADVLEWLKAHFGLPSQYAAEFDDEPLPKGSTIVEPSTLVDNPEA